MTKYYVDVDSDGDIFWYKDPEMKIIHRDGGPAMEFVDGAKCWFKDGDRHREDGPAMEWANGDVEYWLKGRRLTKEQWKAAVRPRNRATTW